MIPEVVVELLKLAGVGLVAGLFSSVLAQRDHRRKTYWEIRVKAYQETIQCLSDLVYYYDVKYHVELNQSDLSDEREAELKAMWDRAFHRLRTHIDTGAFLFSKEANQALLKMRQPGDQELPYFLYLESLRDVARQTLDAMVQLSKVDLELRSRWVFWKR